MTPFAYRRPPGVEAALGLLAEAPDAAVLAGGTCLLDLMKQGVERPGTVIDLNFAPDLQGIAVTPRGTLRIGAATTLSHVARSSAIAGWPLLHETIVDGLTPQLRNAATVGGNVMQRPRCFYFREPGFACNKREPGAGCAARDGVHFQHALFGGAAASACIAVHPSDLCVALAALDASAEIAGPAGRRTLALSELHRLPGGDATRETNLQPGELLTAVDIPPQDMRGGAYVKGNEGFALASCAALLGLRDGRIDAARIMLGGVAHAPWRAAAAEAALADRQPTPELFATAAAAAVQGAEPDQQTAFRVDLVNAVVAEALERALARAGDRS